MYTARRTLIIVSLMLLVAGAVRASGSQVEIYGIVSKVVMEPNDGAPERIQIWGVFTLFDGATGGDGATLTPQRGYLYFNLPTFESARQAALKEVADFKAIAGTGQAVAFGRFGYIGAFRDELMSFKGGNPPYLLNGGGPGFNGSHSARIIRAESEKPAAPESYPLNMGLTKLSATGSLAAVVKRLEQTK